MGLDGLNVINRALVVPAPAEPSTNTSPNIACMVARIARRGWATHEITRPPFVAGADHPVHILGAKSCIVAAHRPFALVVDVLDLENAVALVAIGAVPCQNLIRSCAVLCNLHRAAGRSIARKFGAVNSYGRQTLRILMLGDSVQQDTANAPIDAFLERAYPECNVELISSTKGGTGVQFFKEANARSVEEELRKVLPIVSNAVGLYLGGLRIQAQGGGANDPNATPGQPGFGRAKS